jgi:hypothetical protein
MQIKHTNKIQAPKTPHPKVRVRGQQPSSTKQQYNASQTPHAFAASPLTHPSPSTTNAPTYSQKPFPKTPTSRPTAANAFMSSPNPSAVPCAPFKERPQPGKVEDLFNANVPAALPVTSATKTAVSVSLPPGQQLEGYRYMHDSLADVGDTMDSWITKMSLVVDREISRRVRLARAVGEGMDVDDDEEDDFDENGDDESNEEFKICLVTILSIFCFTFCASCNSSKIL